MRSRLFPLLALAAALTVPAWLAPPPAPAQADDHECDRYGPDDPPCNPALPDSPWGTSHRNSYAQKASPFPGPRAGDEAVTADHVDLPGVPIQLEFSQPYEDGGVAVWGSLVNAVDSRGVVKADHETGRVIDVYVPAEREADAPPAEEVAVGTTGAYNVLDRDGRFYVPRQRSIEVFADEVAGDRFSPIRLLARVDLPDEAFCGPDDALVGATMTYDGRLALVSSRAVVSTVPRDPEAMLDEIVSTPLNGDRCAGTGSGAGDLEEVSNSIAADEDGGIYVVTSTRMVRVQWDPEATTLAERWSAPYEATRSPSAISLGPGSGSTPALMGTEPDDDRFVVITDAQDVMHVVLFWRDEVPDGWEPVAPGKDPRIACEFPVTFGDPDATTTRSEQSVLVYDTATVHAQNRLGDEGGLEGLTGLAANALAAFRGGDPAIAPRGVERIDWDPEAQTCRSVWANPDLSIPNAIPTMSFATGLVYAVGQRNGTWGLEGIDIDDGEPLLWVPGPNDPCPADLIGAQPEAVRDFITEQLRALPNSCENSFYAATQVGPDGTIYTGTFFGMTTYRPDEPLAAPLPDGTVVETDDETAKWVVALGAVALIAAAAVVTATRLRRRDTP